MEKFKNLDLATVFTLAQGIWAENRGEPLPNTKPHETGDLFTFYVIYEFGGEVKDIDTIIGAL